MPEICNSAEHKFKSQIAEDNLLIIKTSVLIKDFRHVTSITNQIDPRLREKIIKEIIFKAVDDNIVSNMDFPKFNNLINCRVFVASSISERFFCICVNQSKYNKLKRKC
jgi:hypothetical protein